jgi:DNA replication protein DnaC
VARSFANRILSAATIDRLRHGAYKVVLEGKSYRSPRPATKQKPEPSKK